MAGGGHDGRTLVAEHRWNHEPLAFSDPGHADAEDVVLGLGEEPGAGGDVYPECEWFALRDGIFAVEGGGVALDCSTTHAPLDLRSAGSGRTAMGPRQCAEATDQGDDRDDEPDENQLGDKQRGPQGNWSGQRRPIQRTPGQRGVGQMMQKAPENARSCAHSFKDRPMSAEDPRSHLAPCLHGYSLCHHERQCPEQHHERALKRRPLLRPHRSGRSSNRLSC
jgi:hypothetical protein